MNESIDYLHEVFEAFGPIRARRMFGGWGIYHDGLMFGLYAAGRLYLKTDAHNLAQFETAGSVPFAYIQRDKAVKLSYWSAPKAAELYWPGEAEPWPLDVVHIGEGNIRPLVLASQPRKVKIYRTSEDAYLLERDGKVLYTFGPKEGSVLNAITWKK